MRRTRTIRNPNNNAKSEINHTPGRNIEMDRLIDGALFESMVKGGAENLYVNKSIVNDLNVFPIPDGDTGDNMYMTIESGASAPSDGAEDLGGVSARIAHGMLLGARGNSGVILSRIFAGIAAGLADLKDADLKTFAEALKRGSTEAYSAVSVPVEGTILTVFRDAVSYAGDRVSDESTPDSYFSDLIEELRNSLQRTPELLDVLKEAGVVDSGGAGLVYIVEGMKNVIDGNEIGGWHCCFKPEAPHIADQLKSGEIRVWMVCEAKGRSQKYDRPESQGGAWLLVEYLKPLRILSDSEVREEVA